ncbi:MAG: hypothetical protein DCC55_34165 [Chloroflexi bacterium]|nr:MAG: hypothetical protein DCC55_34165 [Chloroflexota bacterium]
MPSGGTNFAPWPQGKATLLVRLETAYRAIEQTVSTLSYTQLTVLQDQRGWTIKDHLAHLVVWEKGTVYLLQKLPRYAGLGIDKLTYLRHDGDKLNAILYEQTHSWSLDTVLAAFKRVHQDLALVLAGLSDDDLRQPYSHFQPDEPHEDGDAPVLAWVADIAGHQKEHLGWIIHIASSTTLTN